MKTVPLSSLKANSTGIIQDIAETQNKALSQRLKKLGYVPGRKVTLQKHAFGGYIAKVNDDTPFAMGKPVANIILVKPLSEDAFEKAPKKSASNILQKIRNIFKR